MRDELGAQVRALNAETLSYIQKRDGIVPGTKCPICGKSGVRKISAIKKAGSLAVFGLLSNNIVKTMECTYCGYKF